MTSQDARHAADILEQGYTVIPDVLDGGQLKAAIHALEAVSSDEAEVGKARNWHNQTYKVAYALPLKDPFFRSIGLNPRLLPIVRAVLGETCNLSNVNGLGMTPGGESQTLHMDAFESTPGTCVYINALHCLDDFEHANGATRVVPGSHREVWKPGSVTPEVESRAIHVPAKAGSVIAYDGALLHAGSRNTTRFPRRALHLYYHRSWAKPQWDYPRSFTPDVLERMSPEEQQLFGFHSAPLLYRLETHESVQPFKR
jgi:ectoine hydroxylase-related dioxygenase (phytanoyl-CoA dioxygenase family)